MTKLVLALSLCMVVIVLCGTTFGQVRIVFTSTTISACKQLVDPGQPVCFTTQTLSHPAQQLPRPVHGCIQFLDEFSGELTGCIDVNRFGQAQVCLPVVGDMDVFAVFYPANDDDEVDLASHSKEVAVFLTTDPGSPKYFPGTHPGCLIPHIAPAFD